MLVGSCFLSTFRLNTLPYWQAESLTCKQCMSWGLVFLFLALFYLLLVCGSDSKRGTQRETKNLHLLGICWLRVSNIPWAVLSSFGSTVRLMSFGCFSLTSPLVCLFLQYDKNDPEHGGLHHGIA